MDKERIDILLVDRGLVDSRSKAKQYIKLGHVYLNGKKINKPSLKVSGAESIEIKGNPIPYVSRGGLKLEKAIKFFDLSVKDKIALDIGASTGGFTDCMLQNGAKRVYAIDVGTNQLVKKLKMDNRVISMEKTNVRYMTENDIDEKANFVSIDVSFISLRLILPVVNLLTTENVDIVALIKPQFEAGKDRIGKNGIVKDIKIHIDIIKELHEFCNSISLFFVNLTYSPVKGGDGNIEYLVHLSKSKEDEKNLEVHINNIVRESHSYL
ncbi:MAG: TlyA family RNA methyltransferase [Firmicutes bacterium]|nr:TlyA family RNA methyltransferase [Bacillota bacterium]